MSKHVNGTRNDIPMGYMMFMQEVQPLQRKLANTLIDNFENNLHKEADESIQGLPQWCQTLAKRTNEGEA
jgi:hypothetical protein